MIAILLLMAGSELSLARQVSVTGDIYLRDLLTTESFAALARSGVKNLWIAEGPESNRNRVIRRDQVAEAILRAHPGRDIDWYGPANVLVRMETQDLDKDAVTTYLRQWTESLDSPLGTVYLDQVFIPSVSSLPLGEIDFEVRPRGRFTPVGRQSLWLDIRIDGEVAKTVGVQGAFSVETMVGVLGVPVSRQQPITEDMVNWSYQRLDRLNGEPLQPEDLDGHCARTTLQPGTLLTSRHVEAIDLVIRNQAVTVVARSRGLTITMRGIALEDGAAGEMVRLKNPETGKVLSGRVTEDGRVSLTL